MVVLNGKGLSVFRSLHDLEDLPCRLVPVRLRSIVPAAAGPSDARIWSLGDGAFESGMIAEQLNLSAEPAKIHGTIVPQSLMSLASYQQSLAATRAQWRPDEPAI